MDNKLYVYLFFIFLLNNSIAQNKQILYDFDQIPQTLMLNPGAEVDYSKHIGVPFLSNIFLQAGATSDGITYNNIFSGTDSFNEILSMVYSYNLDNSDYFSANQQIEVLNAGFRLRNPDYYLSFGMYQEIDAYANYPKEVATLFFEGDYGENGELVNNGKTNFDRLNFIADMIGVFHVGISKKMSDRLNIGARLKLISGATNIYSIKNNGNYYLGNDSGRFDHDFNDMQVVINTSGFINPDGSRLSYGFSDYVKGLLFLNGNVGVGVDLGFTFHPTENVVVTGSLLDLDYVSYTNKVTTYQIDTDFILQNDAYFNPTPGNEISYWEDVFDNGDYIDLNKIPIDTLQTGYNTYRSPKVNLSGKYQFLRIQDGGNYVFRDVRSTAYSGQEFLISEVGLQTFTAIRPDRIVWAITAFYSHQFNKYISSKVTYTYDKFSYKNIGFGISTHYKDFNFYATADNLLNLYTIRDSNYQSFQFGMNFIFE